MNCKVAHTAKECPPFDMSFGAFYPYFGHIARTLVEYFEVHTALDIGCNTGALVKAFRDLGIEAYGVDVSQAVISNAPQEVKGYLTQLNITQDRLPFEDGRFDLVTILDVLEHLPHFHWGLCEIRRVLKVDRHVFISSPSKLTEIFSKITLHQNDPAHVNVHSKQFWVKLFGSYGLEYLCDFPKAERKNAVAPLFNSKFQRLVYKVYSMPFVPDFRSNLIFQKRR